MMKNVLCLLMMIFLMGSCKAAEAPEEILQKSKHMAAQGTYTLCVEKSDTGYANPMDLWRSLGYVSALSLGVLTTYSVCEDFGYGADFLENVFALLNVGYISCALLRVGHELFCVGDYDRLKKSTYRFVAASVSLPLFVGSKLLEGFFGKPALVLYGMSAVTAGVVSILPEIPHLTAGESLDHYGSLMLLSGLTALAGQGILKALSCVESAPQAVLEGVRLGINVVSSVWTWVTAA